MLGLTTGVINVPGADSDIGVLRQQVDDAIRKGKFHFDFGIPCEKVG